MFATKYVHSRLINFPEKLNYSSNLIFYNVACQKQTARLHGRNQRLSRLLPLWLRNRQYLFPQKTICQRQQSHLRLNRHIHLNYHLGSTLWGHHWYLWFLINRRVLYGKVADENTAPVPHGDLGPVCYFQHHDPVPRSFLHPLVPGQSPCRNDHRIELGHHSQVHLWNHSKVALRIGSLPHPNHVHRWAHFRLRFRLHDRSS